jgi:retron-type reverse transcriptase
VISACITEYLNRIIMKTISPNQFGFIPGRKPVQAWEEILKRAKQENKRIFEFDLTACFNRINIEEVSVSLIDLGVPKYAAN